MKPISALTLTLAALGGGVALVGCSTDENPITPDKMQEIRKKEAKERANFNPSMAPPVTK